ncbi:hypothetical protein GLOIN_2v1776801 [Rhizophagus irregularis DAOM 181602=DAOM 197198]|nr:hypothetical protein GLOIN_2v1776801 [Rhizophagus irregularis DAOM 181602=DAOM 197198]
MREQTTVGQSKKNQLSISVASKTTKVRPQVPCNCKKCNGKWTESRTREKHYAKEEKLRLAMEEPDKKKRKVSGSNSATIKNRDGRHARLQFINPAEACQQYSDEDFLPIDDETLKNRDARHARHQFINPAEVDQQYSDEDFLPIDDETLSDDDEALTMKQFSAPDFDDTVDTSNTRVNFSDTWILLWIFKYQTRFQLSDSAIDALIKFFKLVLLEIDKNRFENFPSSAYMAKKLMGFIKKSNTYAVCPQCNKLFNPTEVISKSSADSSTRCNNVEFPNHPIKSQRKSCNTALLKKVPISKGYIWRPIMIYPLPCLKTQLVALYQRAGFEELLRKWTNRSVNQGLMFDIYDGDIWKTFPSQHDIPDPSPFFAPETADTHLGIIFKKEYMLTLGLLPGPTEVKLHHINHYLAPIVDVLLEFWHGFDLPVSSKHPTGKRIRLAVICCSNDIPAAQKLCSHISALVGCHRCYKCAERNGDNKRPNFGGFDNIGEWFRERSVDEHRCNAEGRVPDNIATGDGFSAFTANQWRSFIMIYATPILWDLLDESDRKILANFVRACFLLVSRIIDRNSLNEAHSRLLTVAKLIEEHYGSEYITLNIHLSLHLTECCHDYGPLYSFWCFSFERMNGILGSYPNSHHQIESELLRIIMQNQKLDDLLSDQSDNLRLQEGLKSFRLDVDETITGKEPFPSEIMKLTRLKVNLPEEICDHLVQYYKDAYNLDFISFNKYVSSRQIKLRNSNQQIIVHPRANQFENEIVEAFPDQVQFFFEHTVELPDGYHTHRLAFVKWYLPVEDQQKRFQCRVNNDNNSCNIEIWKYDFYNIGRDSIILVHNIYARFITSDFTIGKRNPIKYMAVIPVNRHFHI